MKFTRRKLLAAGLALAGREVHAQSLFAFGAGSSGSGGAPAATFLSTLAGPAAGTLNMLPWGAYATHSDFTVAGYTKTRSSISVTNIAAPDGTLTGQHLSEDSSTNTHFATCLNTPSSESLSFIPIRVAVIAKAAERTRMVVEW